jgi:hypothetical protein
MAITIYKKGTDPTDRSKNVHLLGPKEWQQYKTDNPNSVITWKGIGQKVKGSLLSWARRFRTYSTKVGPVIVGKGTSYSKTYRHHNAYSTGTKPKKPYNRFDRPTVPVSLNTGGSEKMAAKSLRPPHQTQSGVTGGSYDSSGIRSGQGGTTQTFVKQYPSPSGVMFGGIVVGPRGKGKARRRYK